MYGKQDFYEINSKKIQINQFKVNQNNTLNINCDTNSFHDSIRMKMKIWKSKYFTTQQTLSLIGYIHHNKICYASRPFLSANQGVTTSTTSSLKGNVHVLSVLERHDDWTELDLVINVHVFRTLNHKLSCKNATRFHVLFAQFFS